MVNILSLGKGLSLLWECVCLVLSWHKYCRIFEEIKTLELILHNKHTIYYNNIRGQSFMIMSCKKFPKSEFAKLTIQIFKNTYNK